MSTAQNLFGKFLASIFTFCVFGLAVSTATVAVFGTPDALKKSLAEGKVYDSIARSVVNEAVKRADAETSGSLASPLVKQAAEKAINPAEVQKTVEQGIDGTYRWLDGTTPTPEFTIDLSTIQQNVVSGVSGAGIDRTRSLPLCTVAQLRTLDTQNIDPFTLPCRPPGINLQTLQKQYAAQIASTEDSTITAQELNNDKGQNVFAQAKEVPALFQFAQKLPWIFGVGILALAPAIIFLNPNRRAGITTLAATLLLAGCLLLFTVLLSNFVFNRVGSDVSGSAEVQNASLVVAKSLGGAFTRVLMYFAISYLLLGGAGFVGLRFNRLHGEAMSPLAGAPAPTTPTKPKRLRK